MIMIALYIGMCVEYAYVVRIMFVEVYVPCVMCMSCMRVACGLCMY